MPAVGKVPIIDCSLAWPPALAVTANPSSVFVCSEIILQAVGTGDCHLCLILVRGVMLLCLIFLCVVRVWV
jgi:hypothetical protein